VRLSIVVPCYNEKENIPLLFDRFSKVIEERDIEVVFVNNGSTDGSQIVFEELIPKFSFSKLVIVDVNQGYGYGILQGLNSASGDYIGWTHADMQTDPLDVIRAYDLVLEKGCAPDMFIKGNRKGRSLFDQIFTSGMSVYESIYFKEKLSDINAQPNIFPRSFFEHWNNPPHDFSLDLYAFYTARREGLNVIRFPVQFPKRRFGVSKWNTGFSSKIKFIKRTLKFSSELKRREKNGK